MIVADKSVGFVHGANSFSNFKDTSTHRLVIQVTKTNTKCLTLLAFKIILFDIINEDNCFVLKSEDTKVHRGGDRC